MSPQLWRGCWTTAVDGLKMLRLEDRMQWSIKTLSSHLGVVSVRISYVVLSFSGVAYSSDIVVAARSRYLETVILALDFTALVSLHWVVQLWYFSFFSVNIWIPFLPLRECSRCTIWHVVFSWCVSEWKKSWLWMCLCREVTAISMPSRMCFDFFLHGTLV